MTVYPYGQQDSTSSDDICGFPLILGTITSAVTYGAFAFGFIGSLFSQSMSDMWCMMQTLQIIYLFPVLNLQMPSCLSKFTKTVSIAMPESDVLAMTLFYGLTNHTWMTQANPTPGYNYDQMGFESTAALHIGADVLSLFVYLFVLDVIFEIIRMTFEENQLIKNLLERFRASAMNGYA